MKRCMILLFAIVMVGALSVSCKKDADTPEKTDDAVDTTTEETNE